MKYPISWHQECLTNMKSSLSRKQEEFNKIQERYKNEIKQLEIQIDFKELQIENAIKQNKNEFNPDLYLKKKRSDSNVL